MVGRRKGTPKTGGRRKGAPNKTTAQLKDMILSALDKAGGVDYLAGQAQGSPAAFLSLVGKILPLQVSGDDNGPPIKVSTGISPEVAAMLEAVKAARVPRDQR